MHFERNEGSPFLALKLARKRHVIATCHPIEKEISRILINKFGWNSASVQLRLGFLLAEAIRVKITGELRACRDPNDDMVLECAVVAGGAIIVSGDKDLLVLNPYEGIRILTAAEFLAAEV
jgi:putative PIN family toxin of toxin-antitoxin system